MKTTIRLFAALLLVGAALPLCAFADNDDDIEVRGVIESLSGDSVTVNGTTALLNENTEYEGLNDENLTLGDFSVGLFVKLELFLSNGALVVHEMELEDESSSSSSSSDDGNSSSDDDDDDDSSSNSGSGGNSGSGDDEDDDDDDNSGSGNIDRFNSNLTPDPAASAIGKVKARTKLSSNQEKRRPRVRALLGIPSAAPSVADESEAAALDVRAVLSRAGVPYAECTLPFKELEDQEGAIYASYRLDLRLKEKKGTVRFRTKNGNCDVDLSAAEVQSGMPEVESGDTISVNGNGTSFLTGTL